jgi:pimeloyl-ACP methyl ester carboxylesterase
MQKISMSIILALACLAVTPSARAEERSVSLTRENGTLYGSLLLPEKQQDLPAVLLISGSGPTDRDGNTAIPTIQPATQKLIAQNLAEKGFISLRFDKRGVGASKSALHSEGDLHVSDYVDDAVAWVKLLQSQPHVRCVVILGHSEGALIGALAAAKTKVCGYISAEGAGFPIDEILLRQYKAAGAPEPLLKSLQEALAQLKAGKPVADVPTSLVAVLRPSIQPYMMSWLAIDPARVLSTIKEPVMIMQGTTDLQVSQEDAERLHKAAPKAKFLLLDGVNHVLKTAPPDRQANIAAYAAGISLAPTVMPAIIDFVNTLP